MQQNAAVENKYGSHIVSLPLSKEGKFKKMFCNIVGFVIRDHQVLFSLGRLYPGRQSNQGLRVGNPVHNLIKKPT